MIDIQSEADSFIKKLEDYSFQETKDLLIDIVNNSLYNKKLRDSFFSFERKILNTRELTQFPCILEDFFLKEFFYDFFQILYWEKSILIPFWGKKSYPIVSGDCLSFTKNIKILNSQECLSFPYKLDCFDSGIKKVMIIPFELEKKCQLLFLIGSRNQSRLSSQLGLDLLDHLILILRLTVNNLIDIERIAASNKEITKLVNQLQETNHELRDLNEMKDHFLMIASHDLRSPLTGIIGLAEMMAADNDLSEKYRKWLNGIAHSGKKQLNLINEILSVIRLEKGKLQCAKSLFPASELIISVKENLMPSLTKKEIQLNENISDDITVYGDKEKLIQVLNNLIYNSIKFSKKKGVISIEAEECKEGVSFVVTDNGIGWKDFEEKALFQAFTPYKRTGTEGEETTGLGLSICANMIRLHGGTISAYSPGMNEGAVFKFFLPNH